MRASPVTIAFSALCLIAVLLVAGTVAGIAALSAMPRLLDRLGGLPSNAWWLLYRDLPAGAASCVFWRIGAAAAATLISLAAVLRLRAMFRRKPSPAIPFLMIFLFSLGLECLRTGAALLFAADGPVSFSLLLTRVIYWGRFVGLLALLVAVLYCAGLGYRKFSLLAGAVLIVSFAMAAYIPMDRTTFLAQLTWKLGDEQSLWFVNLAIGLLVIFTGAAAARDRKGPKPLTFAAGVALLVASRELEFFALQPAPLAAGLLTLAAGAFLCLRSVGEPGLS